MPTDATYVPAAKTAGSTDPSDPCASRQLTDDGSKADKLTKIAPCAISVQKGRLEFMLKPNALHCACPKRADLRHRARLPVALFEAGRVAIRRREASICLAWSSRLPRTDGSEPGLGQMNELRPNAIKRLPRGTEARLLHRCDRKRKIFVRNLP